MPRTHLTSIFEGQPPKTRPKFQSKQGPSVMPVFVCYWRVGDYDDKRCIDIAFTTPRKINMERENTPLEEEKNLPNHHFQVPC